MADCSKAEKAQSPFYLRRVSCRLQADLRLLKT